MSLWPDSHFIRSNIQSDTVFKVFPSTSAFCFSALFFLLLWLIALWYFIDLRWYGLGLFICMPYMCVDLVLPVFAPFSLKVEAWADHQEKPSILSFSPRTSNLIRPPDFSISKSREFVNWRNCGWLREVDL